MQATHIDFFSLGLGVFRPARPCVSSRPLLSDSTP